jgi:two-component system sensor histidine kinase ResE
MLGSIAWSLGAPPLTALLSAVAAALAMWVERLATRRETSRAVLVNCTAATREASRDSEARLLSLELAYDRSRSVLEALREGVVVVDGGGEVVLANPAARRAMRTQGRDPQGEILWDVLAPELAQRAQKAWQALGATDTASPEAQQQIRHTAIPCGESVFDLTAVQARSAQTGQEFGTVYLLVDTTRSHELQRLKDRFLSSVSHELRTPLTNICAYSEILCTMAPSAAAAGEEWPEFARVVHEEGLQLSRLVDGMFDFLQLESGEAVFDHAEIDPAPIVRIAVQRCQPSAFVRGIALELCVRPSAARVAFDRVRLDQVCRHLLDNAIKFTPDGGRVLVTIGIRDASWELRVEDSGPGVPQVDRAAVFDKFHQLSDHLTGKTTGTGLGLSTSRAIVTRGGGLIWCDDSSLGGAAFVVMLPLSGQPGLAGSGAGAVVGAAPANSADAPASAAPAARSTTLQ